MNREFSSLDAEGRVHRRAEGVAQRSAHARSTLHSLTIVTSQSRRGDSQYYTARECSWMMKRAICAPEAAIEHRRATGEAMVSAPSACARDDLTRAPPLHSVLAHLHGRPLPECAFLCAGVVRWARALASVGEASLTDSNSTSSRHLPHDHSHDRANTTSVDTKYQQHATV
jgi:hypothetical protein